MIRPTPKAVILLALCAPSSLALVLYDERLWTYGLGLLAFALLLICLDWLLAPTNRGMNVIWQAPSALYIGDEEAFRLRAWTSPFRKGIILEALLDVGENLNPPEKCQLSMVPDHQTEQEIPLRAKRRGPGELSRLWLRWRGPLGLMERSRQEDLNLSLSILPNIKPIRDNALQFSSRDSFFGSKVQNLLGDGSEFDSLKEYSPGMDHRSIDWKHSARHFKLVAKEFHAERNQQIVLAFDTGHLMTEPEGPIAKLDHAINAGLLLGYTSLMVGDRVGIFGFDSKVRLYSEPSGSMRSFTRLQHACAQLDYSHEETNFTLGLADLMGRLSRRSLVIIYTDFIDTISAEMMMENIQRLTRRHLVLFVTLAESGLLQLVEDSPYSSRQLTTAVTAHNFLQDRQIVLEKLRRMGVHCLETTHNKISTDLINKYLTIKRLEQI